MVDESLTNWRQLLDLLYNYCKRVEDTTTCEGDYTSVPDQDEELGSLIWTLQEIYYQHKGAEEKEGMDLITDLNDKRFRDVWNGDPIWRESLRVALGERDEYQKESHLRRDALLEALSLEVELKEELRVSKLTAKDNRDWGQVAIDDLFKLKELIKDTKTTGMIINEATKVWWGYGVEKGSDNRAACALRDHLLKEVDDGKKEEEKKG